MEINIDFDGNISDRPFVDWEIVRLMLVTRGIL